ncbi:hypothetical protein [Streptantibioticus ferralitis]|uniref:Protein kinase domain-containing protein n=1 Tax=Streptantibioticus ferralitis TaxID=236510 RepID=A0ABT5YW04_9ACTN|nr:hypothetical protein [Streptantibioticus ferralitis]MDF2255526.1 hypothetical protein [Streptantibioticus ferralitis]
MAAAAGPFRQFPTGGEYSEAMQNTHLCFRHPELKGAVPELTKIHTPKAISGAFASVFSLTSAASGRRYAVKCFTRHIPDQEMRYEAISKQLVTLDSTALSQPWKMGFEYLPDAILVGAERYPVLKMEWVEAVTLSAWLDTHHHDSAAVARLADRFSELAADLVAHDIAHGDLQHGNLLVADDGTLRLVDYDGMYVPALSGREGTERGHRNYQSPARGDEDFDSHMDRFSAWVIFLALKAVAADARLWAQLHERHGEYLLLAEDDFKNPSASSRFPALLAHRDQTVRDLADQVRSLSWQPLDALPPLPSAPVSAPTLPLASAAPHSADNGSTLPSWMSGHLPPVSSAPPAEDPDAPPTSFTGRRALDVLAAVLLPITVFVPAILCAAGVLASLLLPLPLTATAFLTWAAHRTRSETRLLRKHVRALTKRRWQATHPDKATNELHRQRMEFDSAETKRKAELTRAQQELLDRHQREVAAADSGKIKKWAAIDRKVSSLDGELRAAMDQALATERATFVQEELRKARIATARLQGIGEKLKGSLAMYGISAAADFTGIRLISTNSGGYASTTALIVKTGGREVNIKGIGAAKARTLDAWRQAQISAAQSRCTIRLSSARRQSITSDFERRRAQHSDERRKAEADAATQRAQAQQRLQDGRVRLSAQDAAALRLAQQQRQAFAQRALQIQESQADLDSVNASLAEARRIRRALSHARYLRFALTGH